MRWTLLFALVAACSTDRPRAGMCDVEHLDVTWPVTIDRGGATTSERLAATLGEASVEPEVFDSLARALVEGRPTASAIVWSVPAFGTDPGGIAILHSGRLAPGAVLRVAGVLDGGGWGVMPPIPNDSALVVVEAGEFVSRTASGTIAVLDTRPLALRLDLTATDSAGSAMRLKGDARFSARRARQRCSSFT